MAYALDKVVRLLYRRRLEQAPPGKLRLAWRRPCKGSNAGNLCCFRVCAICYTEGSFRHPLSRPGRLADWQPRSPQGYHIDGTRSPRYILRIQRAAVTRHIGFRDTVVHPIPIRGPGFRHPIDKGVAGCSGSTRRAARHLLLTGHIRAARTELCRANPGDITCPVYLAHRCSCLHDASSLVVSSTGCFYRLGLAWCGLDRTVFSFTTRS